MPKLFCWILRGSFRYWGWFCRGFLPHRDGWTFGQLGAEHGAAAQLLTSNSMHNHSFSLMG